LGAAPDHRLASRRRSALEEKKADGQRQLQIVFAERISQRVPELFELDQRFASVLRTGAAEYFDRTGSETDPVLVGQRHAGQETVQQQQPQHAFIFAF